MRDDHGHPALFGKICKDIDLDDIAVAIAKKIQNAVQPKR